MCGYQCEHSELRAIASVTYKNMNTKYVGLQDPTARLNSATVPLMTISGISIKVFIVSRVSAMLTRPKRRLIASLNTISKCEHHPLCTYLTGLSSPTLLIRSGAQSHCFSVLESCGISRASRDRQPSEYSQLKRSVSKHKSLLHYVRIEQSFAMTLCAKPNSSCFMWCSMYSRRIGKTPRFINLVIFSAELAVSNALQMLCCQ